MRVALIQYDIAWNDDVENYRRISPLIADAATRGARLIVLPEMFNSGFSFLSGDEAVQFNRSGVTLLQDLSSKHDLAICASMAEPSDCGRPFNTLYVFDRGELLGSYRKLHLFSFGGEPEKYQGGSELLRLSLDNVSFSFFICYDLRFPVPFELLGSKTDAFVVVANWPAPRALHWRTLLTARAIEQQAYVIGVNRIGTGGGLEYSGDSIAVSPRGELIADAKDSADIFYAQIDPNEVSSYRSSFTALKDRLPELYEAIAQRS